jgi:Rrf2 family nitric oxide-sensitive transcriptional repressor
MDLVECFDPATNACRIEPVCALRGVLEEALAAFLDTLDGYTLADLTARRRGALARLLTQD